MRLRLRTQRCAEIPARCHCLPVATRCTPSSPAPLLRIPPRAVLAGSPRARLAAKAREPEPHGPSVTEREVGAELHPDPHSRLGHPGLACRDLPAGHAHRWVGAGRSGAGAAGTGWQPLRLAAPRPQRSSVHAARSHGPLSTRPQHPQSRLPAYKEARDLQNPSEAEAPLLVAPAGQPADEAAAEQE